MEADIIRLELPAEYKYLHVLTVCIEALLERVESVSESSALLYDIQLAVQEACTNIIRHAYANQVSNRIWVTLTLEAASRRFIIDLYDTGQSFDPAQVPPPNFNEPQLGGMGWYLIRELMDEVIYQNQSGKNHLRLVKNL